MKKIVLILSMIVFAAFTTGCKRNIDVGEYSSFRNVNIIIADTSGNVYDLSIGANLCHIKRVK